MPDVDTKRISEKLRAFGVDEINQVVGVWEIRTEGLPVPLKAKVTRSEDYQYRGALNYRIKGAPADPGFYETTERALEGSLFHFFKSYFYGAKDMNSVELNKDF